MSSVMPRLTSKPLGKRVPIRPAPRLEMAERVAIVTTIEPAVEIDALAAVTVSALAIVAEAFGSELRIPPKHRQGIADLRDRMNRGDRSAPFFGHEALEAVDRALAARSPSAHKRLHALCERVTR